MVRRFSMMVFALVFAGAPGLGFAEKPIPTGRFADSANHWRNLKMRGVIEPEPDQPRYKPSQFREIADNIVLFQREDGGWPANYDMMAILTPEQKKAIAETKSRRDGSFDNDTVHPQVTYLAHALQRESNSEWRDACERGLDYILAAQYPNGGFPQKLGAKGYSAHITFNDNVMMGILNVLADVALGEPRYDWLDDDRRARCVEALKKGVDCVLKCQIKVDGQATGWAQQHDEKTYEPRPARKFEPTATCALDTADVTAFLTRLEPTDEIAAAIESAAAWLDRVKLEGIRAKRVKAPREEFPLLVKPAETDLVVVEDPDAPAIWARFYEIGTDRPIFVGRDAVVRYNVSEIERERRIGYGWYGSYATRVLEKTVPQWRERTGR